MTINKYVRRIVIAVIHVSIVMIFFISTSAAGEKKRFSPKVKDKKEALANKLTAGFIPISSKDFKKGASNIKLSLEEVITTALNNNQEIKINAYKLDLAKTNALEAKAVYDPEVFADWKHSVNNSPSASQNTSVSGSRSYRNDTERSGLKQHLPSGANITIYREWNSGVEKSYTSKDVKGHGGGYAVEVSQPILKGLFDYENRSIIKVTRLQKDMSKEDFKKKVTEILAEVVVNYWNLALSREDVRIYENILEMAKVLLEREVDRQKNGISNELDVNRAREAVASRESNLVSAVEQNYMLQEKLLLLLNNSEFPISSDINIVTTESMELPLLLPDMNKSIDNALLNRPEVLGSALLIEANEIKRKNAKHNLLPKLDFLGSVKRNDKNTTTPTSTVNNDINGTDWSIGLNLSMPLGNIKARSAVQKAEIELAESIDEQKNIKDNIIFEVRTAVKNLESVVREIPLSKSASKAAEKIVEGEWARFELNQVSNRDLLQAQDLLAITERNKIKTMIDYNISIIRLLVAEGVLLNKLGIDLDY